MNRVESLAGTPATIIYVAMENFPITRKGLRFVLAGLIVMVAGYILLAGGGVKDPEVFNYAMFDFRRLVAAPVVILCGVVVIIAGIMNRNDERGNVKSE